MRAIKTALLAGALVTVAAGAKATPTEIAIGLQEAGYNGGAITTESSSTTPAAGDIYSTAINSVNYGTFVVNNVTGTGQTAPTVINPTLDDSNAINVTSGTAGSISVYVSQTGVTSPINLTSFESAFTNNLTLANETVSVYTYLDTGNVLYGTSTLIDTATLGALGTSDAFNTLSVGAGPYSVTDVFVITAISNIPGAETNATIDLSTVVPEPGTLTLLGAGLVGLGFIRRRTKQS